MTAVKELLCVEDKGLALEISGGRVVAMRRRDTVKTGMRLADNGRIALASHVGDVTESELERRCLALRGAAIGVEYELPAGVKLHRNFLAAGGFAADGNSSAQATALWSRAQEALDALARQAPGFVFSGKVIRTLRRLSLGSTRDVDLRVEHGWCGWELLFRRRGSPQIIDGYFSSGVPLLAADDLPDFAASVDQARLFLDTYDTEVTIEPGIRTVLFVEPGFLFEKMSQSCLPDRYHSGTALYSGKLGRPLFAEGFSLFDARVDAAAGLFAPFDGEGTVSPSDRWPLFERGVFTNLIYDLRRARKYSATSTANGQRSFDAQPGLGFHALQVGAGEKPWRSLVAEAGQCIVVLIASGGDFTDTGHGSTAVNLAYLAQDGRIVGRLPQLTMSYHLDELFGPHFLGVSQDVFHPGYANPCLLAKVETMVNG